MKKLSLIILMSLLVISLYSFVGSAEKGKLTMLLSRGGSGETLAQSAEKFTEETGIEIEVLFFPMDELFTKEALALSQGMPTPDIISVNETAFVKMLNYLEPLKLDKEKINSFMPVMIESFRWPRGEGPYRIVPVRMGGDVIMYRQDVFEEEGIDPASIKTWEDFLSIAKKLTKPTERQWGYVQAFSPHAYLVTQWINIVRSYGVDLFNSDITKAEFNTENGVRATKVLVELVNEASPPGVLNYDYGNQIEAMQTGVVVLSMVWTPRFLSINSPDFPHHGEFKVLPHFPIGKGSTGEEGTSMVYGWGFGINKNSENKDLALKYLNFVTSKEEQLRLATEFANSPTVSDVYKNPVYLSSIPEAPQMEKALGNAKNYPLLHEKDAEILDAIGLELQKAMLKEKTVEEALASAEKRVNEIIAE